MPTENISQNFKLTKLPRKCHVFEYVYVAVGWGHLLNEYSLCF